MADENTTPETGNGTPAPAPAEGSTPEYTPEQIKVLAKASGLQVFDSSEMHGLKTKVSAKSDAEKAQLQAEFDSLKAEHTKLAEWKSAQDNQGKSEAELHREQRKAWAETDKAKDAMLAESEKTAKALQKQLEMERIQNKISLLMPDAQSPEMAMMWAKEKIGKLLSTDDAGSLIWTDANGIPHEGEAAKKMFSDWWAMDAQKPLRTGHTPGPVTSGAPSAPPPPAPEGPPKYDRSKSSMENYLAGDLYDEKTRGRQVP